MYDLWMCKKKDNTSPNYFNGDYKEWVTGDPFLFI